MLSKKMILNEAANSGFVRPLSDDEREKLKKTLLCMTAEIDAVCRKYDIKMFLVGGSLLGAIRHGGFVPDNWIHQKIKGIWCNGLMIIASSVTDYTYPNEEYKQMMYKTRGGFILYTAMTFVGFLFSWRSPAKWFNTVDKAIQYKKKTGFITSATGRRHYLGEIFPTDVFLPLQEIKFENLTLFAPANPDAYLRHNYGDDYMTPPPDGKRESHFVKRLEL